MKKLLLVFMMLLIATISWARPGFVGLSAGSSPVFHATPSSGTTFHAAPTTSRANYFSTAAKTAPAPIPVPRAINTPTPFVRTTTQVPVTKTMATPTLRVIPQCNVIRTTPPVVVIRQHSFSNNMLHYIMLDNLLHRNQPVVVSQGNVTPAGNQESAGTVILFVLMLVAVVGFIIYVGRRG